MTLQVAFEADQHSARLLHQLVDGAFASRLFAHDPMLWGVAAAAEAAKRLAWVDPFAEAASLVEEATSLRSELHNKGIDRILLCGMGGSSLAPEVISRESEVQLVVADSTHPHEMNRLLDTDLSRTAVVVSSKSGSTVETLSQAAAFESAFERDSIEPRERLIFITDPHSPISSKADDGFRVFLADPHVGGRFSALTAFGLVPTTLAGADTLRVIDEARAVRDLLASDRPDNPALRLAVALYRGLPEQYLLLLDEVHEPHWHLADWIEQLVAESTGKDRKGVLPIALPHGAAELTNPPSTALLMRLGALSSDTDGGAQPQVVVSGALGAQLLLWQAATAVLGALIGTNPFDQPDVEAAKAAARSLLLSSSNEQPEIHDDDLASLPACDSAAEDELVASIGEALAPGGYVAIQAFVDRLGEAGARAQQLRDKLAAELNVPVSLGWGPRYLHSVGQFHKGGPPLGVFLQLIETPREDCSIPNSESTFGDLMLAQAEGDSKVLRARGRTVITRKFLA